MSKKRYSAEEIIQKLREPMFYFARGTPSARYASRFVSAMTKAPEVLTTPDASFLGSGGALRHSL